MRLSRVSFATSLAALLLLTGCVSKMMGLSPQRAQQPVETATGTGVVSSDAPVAVKSSAPAKLEFEPEITDILTVFQDRISPNSSDGFDTEDLVGTTKSISQLMLISRELKLNSSPEQSRIFYVISGRGDIVLDGSGTSIRAGHVIAVPPGVSLKITPAGQQPLRLVVFKTPGQGHSSIDWLKEKEPESDTPETEVDLLAPVKEKTAASSSSEEFQTGTLTPDEPEDVQMGDN